MAKLHFIRVDPARVLHGREWAPKTKYSWRDVEFFQRRAARRRRAAKWGKAASRPR